MSVIRRLTDPVFGIKKVKEKVSYYFSGQSILTHQQSASGELTACNFGLIIRLAKGGRNPANQTSKLVKTDLTGKQEKEERVHVE